MLLHITVASMTPPSENVPSFDLDSASTSHNVTFTYLFDGESTSAARVVSAKLSKQLSLTRMSNVEVLRTFCRCCSCTCPDLEPTEQIFQSRTQSRFLPASNLGSSCSRYKKYSPSVSSGLKRRTAVAAGRLLILTIITFRRAKAETILNSA